MLTDEIKVGDIVFTDRPAAVRHFVPILTIGYQYACSFFANSRSATDYHKIHAFICTEKTEDKIMIAHIGGVSKKYGLVNIKANQLINSMSVEILRPLNKNFADELAECAAYEENKEIRWTYSSVLNVLSCCVREEANEKTFGGFSIESNCARFVAEAVELADKSYLHGEVNQSIASLLEKLKSTGLFQVISIPHLEKAGELKKTV